MRLFANAGAVTMGLGIKGYFLMMAVDIDLDCLRNRRYHFLKKMRTMNLLYQASYQIV